MPFHDAIMGQNPYLLEGISNLGSGTKFAPVYHLNVAGSTTQYVYLRLSKETHSQPFNDQFSQTFIARKEEADDFYSHLAPKNAPTDLKK